MAIVSGYATTVVEVSGQWANPGNIIGPSDSAFAENSGPNYETIAGIGYGFTIPADAVITRVAITTVHKRSSGAIVSGTPFSQMALTRGGQAPYGPWFQVAAPDPEGQWQIEGPPSTFGLADIPPSDVDESFGIIYRRSVNADESPTKSRMVDSMYIEIEYARQHTPSGGVVLGGSAPATATYHPSGGVVLGGSAILQGVLEAAFGGVVLGGSAEVCLFSPIQITNCALESSDVRVRGDHTNRVEEWYQDTKTGLWYPASKTTTVHGETLGSDLAHEPLRFPEDIDED